MRLTRVLVIACVALGMAGMRVVPAHAQSTFTVDNCSNDSQLRTDVTQANTDNDGDTINITCTSNPGPIPISSPLFITGTMAIQGSPGQEGLSGQTTTQIFYVGNALSSPTLTLNNLLLGSGYNNLGGAIEVYAGGLNVNNSWFTGNSAAFDGGAIFNNTGTVTITNSTFTANHAADYGGVIYNDGTLTISNSTFDSNSADDGAVIYNTAALATATAVATNSTFSTNDASTSGAVAYTYNGSVTFGADIIAYTTSGGDCTAVGTGTFVDWGYNLEDNSPGTCGFSTANHDILGADPNLGPLGDNGGPTMTRALQPGSPAIDYIPVGVANNLCPATGGTDQRGFPRPDANEAYCDIGAYEYQDTETPTGNGQNAYDIESSNWYCTGGGSACVPNGSAASECYTLAPCPGVNYADVEAFGPPHNTTGGVPDEVVFYCSHGTSTGFDYGYLDVISNQGNTDYPLGGVYGQGIIGAIGGKGTLIGGGGSESNTSQPSSVNASAYDPVRQLRGSVTGTQNTNNDTNKLNNGQFTLTLTGRLWHVTNITTNRTVTSYTGTISCTVGGIHAYDLFNAGKDTNALAEGEYENSLGDNFFLQGLAPRLV